MAVLLYQVVYDVAVNVGQAEVAASNCAMSASTASIARCWDVVVGTTVVSLLSLVPLGDVTIVAAVTSLVVLFAVRSVVFVVPVLSSMDSLITVPSSGTVDWSNAARVTMAALMACVFSALIVVDFGLYRAAAAAADDYDHRRNHRRKSKKKVALEGEIDHEKAPWAKRNAAQKDLLHDSTCCAASRLTVYE